MSQTAGGRDVLGMAREVTGEVGVEETSRGAVTKINDCYEQTVHDPRLLRALERMAAQLTEACGLLRDVKETLSRKL